MKKLIVNIFIYSLVLLCTVGFSAWYIIYQIELKPEKTIGSISKYFDVNQEVVYNGQEQVPVHKPGAQIDFDPATLTYSYKLVSETNFTNGKPINANAYDVMIKTTDGRGCKVKFTIKPKEVRLDPPLVEINYPHELMYWGNMVDKIKTIVKFVDDKDGTPINVAYNVDEMTNGDITFSNTSNSGLNVYGSTYHVNISLSNSNYKIIGDSFITLKYKTVKVNNVYYTIEDALKTETGDIILCGDNSSRNSYVVTSFSKLLNTTTYDVNNRRILLPFDAGRMEDHVVNVDGHESKLVNVYSTLKIPSGITLTLSNNSKIDVAGVVKPNGLEQSKVGGRSVLLNNGTINLKGGCILQSYGFTQGTGIINVDANAEVLDVLYLKDWPGGNAAKDYNGYGVFPVLQWSVHNITCATKVFKEGRYRSMTFLHTGKADKEFSDIYIIGDSNTTNCLFKPNGGLSTDYIIKSANAPKNAIADDSQNVTYQNEIKMSGKYIDATMSIGIEILVIGFIGFKTSTSVAVPISYFDIVLLENTQLSFVNSSYILYENTNIIVNKNATLLVEGSAYVFSLQNSKITVNGRLGGSGRVATKDQTNSFAAGSPINTETANAVINLTNFNVTECKIRNGANTYATINGVAEGIINQASNVLQFNNGSVYVSEGNDPYYFAVGSNVNTFYIDLNVNGKIETIANYSFEPSLVFNVNRLANKNIRHYDFDGWYLDNTYLTKFTEHTFTKNNERITLYAKFKPKVYIFNYIVKYNDGTSLTDVPNDLLTYSNLNQSFTIEDLLNGKTIPITTQVTYLDKYFDGWYFGFDKVTVKDKIPAINEEMVNMYLNQVGDNTFSIPLYCEFSDSREYKITFSTGNETALLKPRFTFNDTINLKQESALLLSFNNNNSYQKYFLNWYWQDKNSSTSIDFIDDTTSLSSLDPDKDYLIELHAKWVAKYTVTIEQKGIDGAIPNYYYMPNSNVDLTEFIIKDAYLLEPKIYDVNNQMLNNTMVTISSSTTYRIEYLVDVNIAVTGVGKVTSKNYPDLVNGINKIILGETLNVSISGFFNEGSVKITCLGKALCEKSKGAWQLDINESYPLRYTI